MAKRQDQLAFPTVSELELDDLEFRFSVVSKLREEIREPDEFFEHIYGKVLIRDSEDGTTQRCVCKGEFLILRLDEIERSSVSLFEVLDSVDDDIIRYYEALFDEHDFKQSIQEKLEPGFGSNLLIVNRVQVHPTYRGRSIGLLLTLKVMDLFDQDCSYVAVRPFPLQFISGNRRLSENDLRKKGLAGFEKAERAAFNRIRAYWSKLGFARVGKSDVYIRSTAYKVPTALSLFTAKTGG